jgi:hypothetical protein
MLVSFSGFFSGVLSPASLFPGEEEEEEEEDDLSLSVRQRSEEGEWQ